MSVSLPFAAGVTRGRSEDLTSAVWASNFEVILLPAQLFAQHAVGFIQLHKLAVQLWV